MQPTAVITTVCVWVRMASSESNPHTSISSHEFFTVLLIEILSSRISWILNVHISIGFTEKLTTSMCSGSQNLYTQKFWVLIEQSKNLQISCTIYSVSIKKNSQKCFFFDFWKYWISMIL